MTLSLFLLQMVGILLWNTENSDAVLRKITAVRSPNCNYPMLSSKECKDVYYVVADGLNDTLHYIWDFSNKPAFFLALTSVNDSISFGWDPDGSIANIRFIHPPKYSFLVIFDKLIEWDDVDDTGLLSNITKTTLHDLNLKWSGYDNVLPVNDSNFVSVEEFSSSTFGIITFQLAAFGSQSHDPMLPRLLHSANCSQIKLNLKKMRPSEGFSNSRWAISMAIFTPDNLKDSVTIDTRKNLDDENSPGIFSVVNVLTPDSADGNAHKGFLQWRPIIYTSPEFSITNSSEVSVMDPVRVENAQFEFKDTLAYKIYGRDGLSKLLVERINVSFGMSQDGFYKKTNYSSWTLLMGYGTPETEKLSLLVILVMAIGLGLPALLTLVGIIFICTRRFNKRKDELSLER